MRIVKTERKETSSRLVHLFTVELDPRETLVLMAELTDPRVVEMYAAEQAALGKEILTRLAQAARSVA